MISLILTTATRLVLPLFLLFSVFLLLRGHNEPGGGFVGGLVAAAAFSLYSVAFDLKAARKLLRVDPHTLIGGGLLAATLSGVVAFFHDMEFLTGRWADFQVPGFGVLTLGSPLLFDVGVYLTVMGVTLMIVFSLTEE